MDRARACSATHRDGDGHAVEGRHRDCEGPRAAQAADGVVLQSRDEQVILAACMIQLLTRTGVHEARSLRAPLPVLSAAQLNAVVTPYGVQSALLAEGPDDQRPRGTALGTDLLTLSRVGHEQLGRVARAKSISD